VCSPRSSLRAPHMGGCAAERWRGLAGVAILRSAAGWVPVAAEMQPPRLLGRDTERWLAPRSADVPLPKLLDEPRPGGVTPLRQLLAPPGRADQAGGCPWAAPHALLAGSVCVVLYPCAGLGQCSRGLHGGAGRLSSHHGSGPRNQRCLSRAAADTGGLARRRETLERWMDQSARRCRPSPGLTVGAARAAWAFPERRPRRRRRRRRRLAFGLHCSTRRGNGCTNGIYLHTRGRNQSIM
jgi:hypothetical protein